MNWLAHTTANGFELCFPMLAPQEHACSHSCQLAFSFSDFLCLILDKVHSPNLPGPICIIPSYAAMTPFSNIVCAKNCLLHIAIQEHLPACCSFHSLCLILSCATRTMIFLATTLAYHVLLLIFQNCWISFQIHLPAEIIEGIVTLLYLMLCRWRDSTCLRTLLICIIRFWFFESISVEKFSSLNHRSLANPFFEFVAQTLAPDLLFFVRLYSCLPFINNFCSIRCLHLLISFYFRKGTMDTEPWEIYICCKRLEWSFGIRRPDEITPFWDLSSTTGCQLLYTL